jgi:hypothetical protein
MTATVWILPISKDPCVHLTLKLAPQPGVLLEAVQPLESGAL